MAGNQGRVEFCVSMGLNNGSWQLDDCREHASHLERLVGLFGSYKIPVTVAAPAESLPFLSPAIVKPQNEIALLASPAWTGPTVIRVDMRRRLPQVLAEFRERQISIQSVVVEACRIDEHRDLLPNDGLRVLRESPTCELVPRYRIKSREKSRGLHCVWPTARFPAGSSWLNRLDPLYRAKKVLHRAMSHRHAEHMAISMPRLLEHASPRFWRSFESFLKLASRMQSQIKFDTLNRGASTEGQSQSQRSLLSSAA